MASRAGGRYGEYPDAVRSRKTIISLCLVSCGSIGYAVYD